MSREARLTLLFLFEARDANKKNDETRHRTMRRSLSRVFALLFI